MTQQSSVPIQQSEVTPSKSDFQVQMNLIGDNAPLCPFCTRGRVFIVGTFDWRRLIVGWCNNPECGPLDDDDKGRMSFCRIFADGSFNRFVPEGEVEEPIRAAAVVHATSQS